MINWACVSVSLCCVTSHPKLYWPKTAIVHALSQLCWFGRALPLWVLTGLIQEGGSAGLEDPRWLHLHVWLCGLGHLRSPLLHGFSCSSRLDGLLRSNLNLLRESGQKPQASWLTVGAPSHFHLFLLAEARHRGSPDSLVLGWRNSRVPGWEEDVGGPTAQCKGAWEGSVAFNQSTTVCFHQHNFLYKV